MASMAYAFVEFDIEIFKFFRAHRLDVGLDHVAEYRMQKPSDLSAWAVETFCYFHINSLTSYGAENNVRTSLQAYLSPHEHRA